MKKRIPIKVCAFVDYRYGEVVTLSRYFDKQKGDCSGVRPCAEHPQGIPPQMPYTARGTLQIEIGHAPIVVRMGGARTEEEYAELLDMLKLAWQIRRRLLDQHELNPTGMIQLYPSTPTKVSEITTWP